MKNDKEEEDYLHLSFPERKVNILHKNIQFSNNQRRKNLSIEA